VAARLKLAEPTLSPERLKLAEAISRRDVLAKHVAALEEVAASANDEQHSAEYDLAKWKEHLTSAVDAEVRNKVNKAIGKPITDLPNSAAEARKAIAVLEDTIKTLKGPRDVLAEELERTSRDFRIAESDIDSCILRIQETAPEVERLLNDMQTAAKAYELYFEAICFSVPRHLQHLERPVNNNLYNRDKTLRRKWESALAALRNDANAPLPN
jgi:chromosome segregation ATPase